MSHRTMAATSFAPPHTACSARTACRHTGSMALVPLLTLKLTTLTEERSHSWILLFHTLAQNSVDGPEMSDGAPSP